jgi:hypothetical protein
MTAPPTSELYRQAHRSFDELARTLSDEEWITALPCTPIWTPREVLSHLAGIPDDALAGRMEGAPGETWTQAQIERNAEFTVDELLERWAAQVDGFAAALDSIGEGRPPIDCHSHEHDIRQGINRPGNRDSLIVKVAAEGFVGGFDLPFPVVTEFVDGTTVTSTGSDAEREPVTLRGVSSFEVFRSRVGRRSAEQVRAYDWSGDPADIDLLLASWFAFGPSAAPIIE